MKHTEFAREEEQLRAKMAEVSARQRDQDALKIEYAADPTDQMQASVERNLLVGLLNQDAQLREDLQHAFDLLDAGLYGRCEDCEKVIASARLKAIPWARCCVRCQELRDREVNESDIFHAAA